MKKILFLVVAAVLSTPILFGRNETPKMPIDSITKKITYSDIVSVDQSTSKLELFSRAREWFAKTYNSSTSVIQMEDKESGKLIGKAVMQVYRNGILGDREHGRVNYTISIYVKDGRYKYIVADFNHTGQYLVGGIRVPDYGLCERMINHEYSAWDPIAIKSILDSILAQVNANSEALISDLKSAMATKATVPKNENW